MLFLLIRVVHSPIFAKLVSDVTLFIFMFWITSKFAFAKGDAMSVDSKSSSIHLKTGDGL